MSVLTSSSTPVNGPVVDYAAHPFLDPELFLRDRHAYRYFQRHFRDHLKTDWHYAQLLNRLLHPIGEEHPIATNEAILASYLSDASVYVRELLTFLPPDARLGFLPDPHIERCNNLRELSRFLFGYADGDGESKRRRQFEAQRKLYLAKLLLQVENTRMVQDGPRHKRYLLELLDREVWSHVVETRDWEACYLRGDNGGSRLIDARYAPAGSECWSFGVRRVVRELAGGRYDIEIHHSDARFKRETSGYVYRSGEGKHEVEQRLRYENMKRSRSASILSKMLRKGINDPLAISDMLGMKFIVATEDDVHQLVDLLHQVLGGPFLFRNQTDLFRHPEDHSRMNRHSAPEYRVFKEDIDLLHPAEGSGRDRPYSFPVELQILTVESFLREVQSSDYVSHRVYKLRQFLLGVMPYVFPARLYGIPDLSDLPAMV